MTKLIASFLWYCTIFMMAVNGKIYKEKYRLQVHYSVPNGWMNDPNGLIYLNGYYNLYYQFVPKLIPTAGDLHWGHARSKDLIHWQNLPIALKPFELGDIYSGCCVLDKNNVSGLAPKDSENGSLVAIYTINSDTSQSQGLAYSIDDGLTWTQYKQNPIISNSGIRDFRDPNIFKRNGRFYMTLAVFDRISFYSSTDLKSWTWLGHFGVDPLEGDKSGVWECPSLVTLKDENNNEHDVLIVSLNNAYQGSVTYYFLGKFNGTRFNSYDQTKQFWLENGYDNYAAVPFLHDPHGRTVIIGWMSNWLYGQNTPTSTWRGQMTFPRELGLQIVNRNIYLVQRPIEELNNIIDSLRVWTLSTPLHLNGKQAIDLTPTIPFKTNSMLAMDYAIDIDSVTSGKVGIRFGNTFGEFISFYFNINDGTYELDRLHSGDVSFHPRFADRTAIADRISKRKLLSGKIILDTGSIEIFADDGLNVFTSLFFPTEPYENIQLIVDIDDAENLVTVEKISVAVLNSIW